MRRLGALPRPGAAGLVLAALLLAGLWLRLWSIDHGLPYVYNPDEELHFVPVAVEFFRSGSFNPGYFENPPALTYFLYLVFKVRFLAGFPFGGDGFARAFAADPTAATLTGRVVVALLGVLAAAVAYWAGRRFYDRRVGLIAAALLALCFMPVFYSKQALNDVVTMVPLAVALVGCLLVLERGRWFDWALAGGAVGVATATKYTAGAMLVTVAVAGLIRLRDRRDSFEDVVWGGTLAGIAFGLAFLVLNPYAVLDFQEFRSQVGGQSAQAGAAGKLGQADVPGWTYYVWTVSWGLGVLPLLAVIGGAVAALRADWRRGLLLVAFPVLLFLFLGAQARYFGRWFLPAYPMLAVLAGLGAVRAAELFSARWPRLRAAALPAVAALLVVQGVFASVRVDGVLANDDTRTLARRWLALNVPAGSRMVVEPFIPANFLTMGRKRTAPARYERFPVKRPFQIYERRLSPGLVGRYRRQGYCWVVVGSTQKERGLSEGLQNARAYYRRLDAAADEPAVFSPYLAGSDPPGFNFDLSFNYLPRAYARPGPVVEVHRLRGCRDRGGAA
jgi:4-amino-4-deoxy-L-arabinose transferase-like glycosyltransferase